MNLKNIPSPKENGEVPATKTGLTLKDGPHPALSGKYNSKGQISYGRS